MMVEVRAAQFEPEAVAAAAPTHAERVNGVRGSWCGRADEAAVALIHDDRVRKSSGN